jgi:hypothetical protein
MESNTVTAASIRSEVYLIAHAERQFRWITEQKHHVCAREHSEFG